MIYSMEATNTEFHAFQFKPIVKLLDSDSRGLLLADEVGLGKTIEAGLIWTELRARFDARRLLVIAPKSLRVKWRRELASKFNVRADLHDAASLLSRLRENEAGQDSFCAIMSLSGLRPPKDWAEAENASPRAQLARYFRDHGGSEPLFDLVIFDEAHHLRNPDTAQHKGAQNVIDVADYKLLLSATPINLRSEDLRNLLKLLDPELFDKDWVFDQLRKENKPIVRARNLALDATVPLHLVLDAIRELPTDGLVQNDRRASILARPPDNNTEADDPRFRAELAAKLEQLSVLGGIVNRTRRRDVIEKKVCRRPFVRKWQMMPHERAFYDAASEAIATYAAGLDVSERFLLSMPQRLMASSLPAAAEHWRNRFKQIEQDGEDATNLPSPLIHRLGRICDDEKLLAELKRHDTKFELLHSVLRECFQENPDEKIIVFSTFRRTIDYLQTGLTAAGIRTYHMHGSSDRDRDDVVDDFRADQKGCVLLTSEIGAEGIDLQFARILFNYDLPWNPMRVEQRIGRIDRIGQESESISIFSLISQDTIEEVIYDRLYQRLNVIEEWLGSFDAILGPIIADFERRLFDPTLSDAERSEEVDRAAQAACNKKLEQDQLEGEADGLLAHGDFILTSIQSAHDNGRWITGKNLCDYIHETLAGRFAGCRLERAATDLELYDLHMTHEAHQAFCDFLDTLGRGIATYLRRNSGRGRLCLVQRVKAVREEMAEFVPLSHPLVRFAAHLRENAQSFRHARPVLAVRTSFPIEIEAGPAIAPGRYGLVCQRWETSTGLASQQKLVTRAINLSSKHRLNETDSEQLLHAVVNQPSMPSEMQAADYAAFADIIQDRLIAEILGGEAERYMEFQQAVFEDKKGTRLQILNRQRSRQLEKMQSLIDTLERKGKTRILPAQRGKLDKYLAGMDSRIAKVDRQYFSPSIPEILGIAIVEVV